MGADTQVQLCNPRQTIDAEDGDAAFGDVSEVEPTDDEPASEPATTPSGDQVVEQLQKSMAKASDLVAKTAAAVDASAKETTELRETVGTTTKALQALVDAKNKTENASPAMSAEILAQVVAQGPEGLRTANVAKVPDLHNIIIRPTIIRTQQRLGDGRRA